jgi:hypothetical protein
MRMARKIVGVIIAFAPLLYLLKMASGQSWEKVFTDLAWVVVGLGIVVAGMLIFSWEKTKKEEP